MLFASAFAFGLYVPLVCGFTAALAFAVAFALSFADAFAFAFAFAVAFAFAASLCCFCLGCCVLLFAVRCLSC